MGRAIGKAHRRQEEHRRVLVIELVAEGGHLQREDLVGDVGRAAEEAVGEDGAQRDAGRRELAQRIFAQDLVGDELHFRRIGAGGAVGAAEESGRFRDQCRRHRLHRRRILRRRQRSRLGIEVEGERHEEAALVLVGAFDHRHVVVLAEDQRLDRLQRDDDAVDIGKEGRERAQAGGRGDGVLDRDDRADGDAAQTGEIGASVASLQPRLWTMAAPWVSAPTSVGSGMAQGPLSEMARWNRPEAAGETIFAQTLKPPANSPKIVTLWGLPPKAPIFCRTHSRANC